MPADTLAGLNPEQREAVLHLDTPLLIVTAGSSVSGHGKFGDITIDQLNDNHQAWQKNLVQLSSHSEHVIIPGATHLSILTQPEYFSQVVEAVRRMVEKIRKENLASLSL